MSFPNLTRAIFTLTPRADGWAVEHDGRFHDQSKNRDEAMAGAARRARASNEAGRPAQIRIAGEPGFTLR
jgi:hypothetical protein